MTWIVLGILIGVGILGYAVYRWRSQTEAVIDKAANTVSTTIDKYK